MNKQKNNTTQLPQRSNDIVKFTRFHLSLLIIFILIQFSNADRSHFDLQLIVEFNPHQSGLK